MHMNISAAADRYRHVRRAYHSWRIHLSLSRKVMLSFGIACIIGLCAQIKFGLPWTPVPVTGQTFAVLLAGILLGGRWGAASVLMYIAGGTIGIPWFSGWSGGTAVLGGPTAGYIAGFIPAAYSIGWITEKYVKTRRIVPLLLLMAGANFLLIHIPGLIILGIFLFGTTGTFPSLTVLLAAGSLPFIAGDVFKIIAAALAGSALAPGSRDETVNC